MNYLRHTYIVLAGVCLLAEISQLLVETTEKSYTYTKR